MKKRLFALFTLILFTLSLFLPSHKAFSEDNIKDSYKEKLTNKLIYEKKAEVLQKTNPQEFKITITLNLKKGSNETNFQNYIFEDKINYDYFQIVPGTLAIEYPNDSSKGKISFDYETNTIIGDFRKLQNNFQKIIIIYNIRLKDGLIIKEDQEVPVSKDTKLTCDVKNEEKITIDLDCSLKIQIKDNTLKDLLTLTQKSEKKEYKLNEEFNLNYSITPREIKSSEVSGLISKPKDVVLMVDTSGSMAWDLYGNEFYNYSNKDKITNIRSIGIFKEFLEKNKYNSEDVNKILSDIIYLESNKYLWYDEEYSKWVGVLNFDLLYDEPSQHSWRYYSKYYREWYEIGYDINTISRVKRIQDYYKKFNFDKSRLDIVKEALYKFLDSFKDKSYGEEVNIVLNTFSSDINEKYLTIKLGSDETKNIKAIEKAKKWISGLNPQEGTNIGAALEEGQRILKSYQKDDSKTYEQYLVMLTDGVPEEDIRQQGYYEPIKGFSIGKNHAITAANNIAKNSPNINNYLLGFSKDSPLEQLQSIASEYNDYNLSNIIKKVTGNNRESILKSVNKEFAKYKKENGELPNFNIKQALKAEDIKEVYAKIAEDINADLTLKNLKFEFQLPTGLEAVELPNGFQYSDGKIIGSLDNVKYTLKNGQYVAEKMDFNIKVKGINPGKIDLENKAKLIYKDIYDRNKEEFFKGLNSVEIKSYSSVISIINHGLFLENTDIFLENTDIEKKPNVSIANKIKSNFGVKIESNVYEAFSMDIVVNSDVSNLSSQEQILVDKKDIAIYRIENGVLKGMPLENIAGLEVKKIGEKTKITFTNFKLQPGEYIISYKVYPRLKDSSNNVSIVNDAICNVDNNKKINQILNIIIQPLPDLD
ncbi:vWA domain-containing protein [Haloimpatiens lingqiaonensis]|uniref:vWA domain-containing protein n=1 Tax=Haloimpatiens lingqiaonensis TaxID=1380675 RepID=UPI0010FE565D|nr:vWA domain-containing protein [Haloimpatiens lingqiaonensis]